MLLRPARQRRIEFVIHEDRRMRRMNLFFGQNHAQSQAGGASAVSHALLEVEVKRLANHRVLAREELSEISRDGWGGFAFFRKNESHASGGKRNELAIEKVRTDRILEVDGRGGDANRRELGAADFAVRFRKPCDRIAVAGIDEGFLVLEIHALVAHAGDVVMEYARIDSFRILLSVDHG
jgi:hypothetical protein